MGASLGLNPAKSARKTAPCCYTYIDVDVRVATSVPSTCPIKSPIPISFFIKVFCIYHLLNRATVFLKPNRLSIVFQSACSSCYIRSFKSQSIFDQSLCSHLSMCSRYTTLPLILSLAVFPFLHARPSFLHARQVSGTDLDGATLEACTISSSVNGEAGAMIMSSTVYKGDSGGEQLATLQTTFPDVFTTPGICWPSDDSSQPPFYLESGLMKYGVITDMYVCLLSFVPFFLL